MTTPHLKKSIGRSPLRLGFFLRALAVACFALLPFACGSIAFAQVPIPPVDPPDSAAKAAASPTPAGSVEEMVAFKSKSRWHLTVNAMDRFGLVITGASFQKSPRDPFIYVLFDGRLGEIFVPYHSGSPRYRDISGFPPPFDFKNLPLDPAKFPPPRQIIGNGKYICKEMRKYLAWMQDDLVRYGEEVVYFSVLGAGNYNYIMEWTFRDDGAILVRAGSTGPKIDAGSATSQGHMHNFTWRLDIDLNGAGGDSAYLTSHLENLTVSPSNAMDKRALISEEGSRVWNPQHFNTLVIEDSTLKNGNTPPRATSYELVPMRSGTARHTEDFTKEDFWVTRYRPEQILANKLPTYISNQQATANQDLVIWYAGSEHHETNSRAEDNNTVPIIWTGFELIPNNLFDGTPFYRNR
jgi:Cu2+-containing amine oxidase